MIQPIRITTILYHTKTIAYHSFKMANYVFFLTSQDIDNIKTNKATCK